MTDRDARDLKLEQAQREMRERRDVREAAEPVEERQHERRADKAAYLQEKLAERVKSEERVDDEA